MFICGFIVDSCLLFIEFDINKKIMYICVCGLVRAARHIFITKHLLLFRVYRKAQETFLGNKRRNN